MRDYLWNLYGLDVPVWLYAPVFLTLWLVAGLIVRALLVHLIGLSGRLLKVLAHSLTFPLVLFTLISGPIALLMWSPLGKEIRLAVNLNIPLAITAILCVVVFLDRLIRDFIDAYADRIELFRTAGALLKGVERGLVVAIGGLIVLDTLGISITPILASLGIGSLAVALALQPTLENLFAGMQIVIDRPVRPGHFVRLESGEEGYVERIGWRSTWIRQLSNSMVIIPNKQMVSSRLTNFYYPSKDQSITVELGVHFDSDLAHVEKVTAEVGEEVMKAVKGSVAEFKPFIRYHTLADSRVNFTVILRAQEFTDGYLIKHEFIKALVKRYAEEGITIPVPIRSVTLEEDAIEKLVEARRNGNS
jgi:small-conductance mechanosensitive channel